MKTCENCGSRVYSLGCTWCNEEAYIEQQTHFDALYDRDRKAEQRLHICGPESQCDMDCVERADRTR